MLEADDALHTPPPNLVLHHSDLFADSAALGTLSGNGPEWTCAIKVSEAPGGPADPPRLSVGGPPSGPREGGRIGRCVYECHYWFTSNKRLMRQNNGEGGCKQQERQFDWRSHDPSPRAVDLTHIN